MRRAGLLLLALAGCSAEPADTLTGYIEADEVLMAPQDAGRIAELAITEGDVVTEGDLLFRLDPARAALAARQAEAAAAAAGSRGADAGALAQAVAEAEAQFENARIAFTRSQRLYAERVIARARLDADRAAFEAAEARLERARAEEEAGGGEWTAASAAEALARQRLDDLSVRAPAAGSVERIYRRAGEVVGAGEPVLSILPDGARKLRFYAPQAMLPSLAVGSEIEFDCDGCPAPAKAKVSFIAREPQFTPPVIYSLEERDKLVFLVEARPVSAIALPPGLPVIVRIAP